MERLLLGTNKSKAMPTELNVTMSCLGHHPYMRLKPVPEVGLTSGMEGVGRGILLNRTTARSVSIGECQFLSPVFLYLL